MPENQEFSVENVSNSVIVSSVLLVDTCDFPLISEGSSQKTGPHNLFSRLTKRDAKKVRKKYLRLRATKQMRPKSFSLRHCDLVSRAVRGRKPGRADTDPVAWQNGGGKAPRRRGRGDLSETDRGDQNKRVVSYTSTSCPYTNTGES